MSKLTRDIIQSEIADFFAGVVEIHTELGGPNTVEEAQNQLTERVLACVPVVDSEPKRNPVLAYADSYRDMAKQGVESVPIWSVITDLERNIAPLCRHAQPAPVVPEDVRQALSKMDDEIIAELDAEESACSAAMLQAGNCRENGNSSTNNFREIAETSTNRSRENFIALCNEFWNWSEMDLVCADDRGYELRMEWDGKVFKHPVTQALWRMYQAVPSGIQMIPDGYVMVPKEPTEDMIAAAMNCDDVLFDSDESFCVQFGNIYEAMLAAAPQPQNEPQNIPEIIPQWIPVSERMPDDDDFVYIWPRPDFGVDLHVGQYCECSPKGEGWYAQIYEQNYGVDWHPITVTHWMPLPAAPQEVNHG
ncbi:DUF551 domain-containing protein [Raoultella sp. WB_B2P2-3]|uniref:DUF551 domain-containing protein n=1 Tax=Raoultella scottii TaxID=3040937 RepID=UPI002F9231B0